MEIAALGSACYDVGAKLSASSDEGGHDALWTSGGGGGPGGADTDARRHR